MIEKIIKFISFEDSVKFEKWQRENQYMTIEQIKPVTFQTVEYLLNNSGDIYTDTKYIGIFVLYSERG